MATKKRKNKKRRRTPQKPEEDRSVSSSLGCHASLPILPTNNGRNDHTSRHDEQKFDPTTQPYHAHFNASLCAFQTRKWRPLTPDQTPTPTVSRCRPVSCRPRASDNLRPTMTGDNRDLMRSRPCSASILLSQKRPDTPRVDHGPFDTLTPRVLAHLINETRPVTPLSAYGDNLDSPRKKKSKRNKVLNLEDKNLEGDKTTKGDTGSMIDSDEVDSDGDESSSDSSDDDSDDNDSISELEKGKEPPIDRNRRAPDLQLRPEQLDHIYVPENRRDQARRFDFDASKCEIPIYEFENPIDPPYNKINFRYHARESTDWRTTNHIIGSHIPRDLETTFDRLLEMEKLQIETEEWEEKRTRQLSAAMAARVAKRRAMSRQLLIGKSPGSRIGSASSSGRSMNVTNGASSIDSITTSNATGIVSASANNATNSKRCCYSCLQQACVGNCPEKRKLATQATSISCSLCWQPLCTGTCTDVRYDQRMRQPRTNDTNVPILPLPPGHKHCKPCQKRHTAKFINANNVMLGRPSSAFSTFSRGKHCNKPKDLRPKSALEASERLSKGIEKLGLDSVQPTPPTSAKPPRPYSRSGVIPGKSYNSNLSRSLTELSSKRRRSAKTKKRV